MEKGRKLSPEEFNEVLNKAKELIKIQETYPLFFRGKYVVIDLYPILDTDEQGIVVRPRGFDHFDSTLSQGTTYGVFASRNEEEVSDTDFTPFDVIMEATKGTPKQIQALEQTTKSETENVLSKQSLPFPVLRKV